MSQGPASTEESRHLQGTATPDEPLPDSQDDDDASVSRKRLKKSWENRSKRETRVAFIEEVAEVEDDDGSEDGEYGGSVHSSDEGFIDDGSSIEPWTQHSDRTGASQSVDMEAVYRRS